MEIVNSFYLCALQGNVALLKELHRCHSIDLNISDKDNITALILSSANNQYEMVKTLLEMGADPNIVRKSGTGSLFFTCQSGYLRIAELLIKYGAEVNQQNKRDFGTPLLVASQNGHTSCVNLLLSHGANINHQLKDGATSLFLAAQGGHVYTVETLVKWGADVNLFKKDLATPLYIASQMGHHKIVKILIDCGAEVDAAREDGSTSMFKAVQKGHRLVIETLLIGGASTGLLGNGESALHMAALFGRTRITHLLLVNGADPFLKNKDGLTSCDLAKEAQFSDLLTVLESFGHNRHGKIYKKPFTAPSSISIDLYNDDFSQYSDSSSFTDQSSRLTSPIPHYSAPTPLFYKWPNSKLYQSFMPPSTAEELISAITSMSQLSTVFTDEIETNHDSNQKGMETGDLHTENKPIHLEKLLATRHSNPEIRELEELRKSYELASVSQNINQCSTANEVSIVSDLKPSTKPIYLKSSAFCLRFNSTQSPQTSCRYIPPNHPPPPLPIPPQKRVSNGPGKSAPLNGSIVPNGNRKMSQPNLKSYQY